MKKFEYNGYISVLQIYLTIKFCLVFTCFLFNKKWVWLKMVILNFVYNFNLHFWLFYENDNTHFSSFKD